MKFSDQDKATLAKLDADVTVNDSNEVAVIAGEMRVEITRAAGDQFRLQIIFPGNEQLLVRIARAQLMRELNIGDDKS